MKVRPSLTWHGSKFRNASQIISLFPDHVTYCEPFGGSGAVLLAKERSNIEIINDIDDSLVNLFRVTQDPKSCKKLQIVCAATPYSRAEFDRAREQAGNPVERARRLIVRQRMSRGGLGAQFSYCIRDSCQGMASVVRRWHAGLEGLPRVHERLKGVVIEQDHWRKMTDRYDTPETLFYLDPPYLPETRIGGGYPHEMSRSDHDELVQRVLRVRGMVVLSGYQHPAYQPLELCGWGRRSYKVTAYSSDHRSKRVEQLWLSPTLVGQETSGLDRKRSGAYQTHHARVSSTEKVLVAAIHELQQKGGSSDDISRSFGGWEKPRAYFSEVPASVQSVMYGSG